MIVLLIAVLIVAWLSKSQLAKLLPTPPTSTANVSRAAGPVAPAPVDVTTTVPVPGTELERARGLEAAVKAQAADMEQRIDARTQ